MIIPDAPTLTDDLLDGLSSDDLIDMARSIRRDELDAETVINNCRDAYRASIAAISRRFVALHSPFAVGERLRLVADGSEWSVDVLSTASLRNSGPTGPPRYVEITMKRFNGDGRIGDRKRTWTFMAGNAADVARFEHVETPAA